LLLRFAPDPFDEDEEDIAAPPSAGEIDEDVGGWVLSKEPERHTNAGVRNKVLQM
jgi:hypothetical protein